MKTGPNLKEWEQLHPDRCERKRDDGQFFGFTGVAHGYLGRFTRFIRIPAVRDAAEDAVDAKGSPITEIMDLVVRSAVAARPDFQRFKEETGRRYAALLDPANLTELHELQTRLCGLLAAYAPDARVELNWLPASPIDIAPPRADVRLVEDGYSAVVPRTGHGLQRALVLTMLQYLAHAQVAAAPSPAEGDSDSDPSRAGYLPDVVLGIEEPELYQHPSRQRHLAKILLKLASGGIPGVAQRTQVIYGTHSPLFVGLDRFHQVRVLRKAENGAGEPKITQVSQVVGDDVAAEIWRAGDRRDDGGNEVPQFTWSSLAPRIQSVMTPWLSEGFFADLAVLVEGEEDRAALLGTATVMGHDLESAGCAVIPCGGKTNLDKPLTIFRRFGIRTFVIWDSDGTERDVRNGMANRRLLGLVGAKSQDYPPTEVGDTYACFGISLTQTMQEEIGEETYNRLMESILTSFGFRRRRDGLKNPAVVSALIQEADRLGVTSSTLREIVGRICIKGGLGAAARETISAKADGAATPLETTVPQGAA